MVLLTMTPSIVEAIETLNKEAVSEEAFPEEEQLPNAEVQDEPSLGEPAVGKPISHGQIVHLWKQLQAQDAGSFRLENLLRGSRVYVAPPPPKPEPSDEYKALMARLRHEEEERKYQRMVSSPSSLDARPDFSQRIAQVTQSFNKDDMGDDDVTFNDVHRQVMLVINFLVTIFGCAATLWVLARWWDTPSRLLLTMGGSLVVAVAEVAVYSGYVWHLGEAKRKDAKTKEIKEVVQTWVVGKEDERESQEVGKADKEEDVLGLRQRKTKEKDEI